MPIDPVSAVQLGNTAASLLGLFGSKPKTIVGGATFQLDKGLLGAGSSKKGGGAQSTATQIGDAVRAQLLDLRGKLGATGPLAPEIFDVYVYDQKGPAPIVINKFGKSDPRPGFASRPLSNPNDAVPTLALELLKRDSDVLGLGDRAGAVRTAARASGSFQSFIEQLSGSAALPAAPAPAATGNKPASLALPGRTPAPGTPALIDLNAFAREAALLKSFSRDTFAQPGQSTDAVMAPGARPVVLDSVTGQVLGFADAPAAANAVNGNGLPWQRIALYAVGAYVLLRLARR